MVKKKDKEASGKVNQQALLHRNVRCRQCLIVDGYTDEEDTCRHCGAKLFKGDVL